MAGEARPLKVFVSYSRADVAFADQLVLALQDKGFEAILDRHDISGAENWRERLGKLILSADAVTFVLTEKSAASDICRWEAHEAKTLGKRIIPVTPGALGSVKPPEELGELNWIPFYADPAIPGSGFYYGVVRLNEALSIDLEWLRAQTRYSERALEWAKEKPEDLLLRGEALREAEAWLARTPAGAHPPEQVRVYLAASGDAEQHRQAAAKAQLEEREQALKTAEVAVAESKAAQEKLKRFSLWALVAGVVLLAIAIPGNYFAATRTLDANDRRAALFADAANDLSRQGDYDLALRMALAGDPPARAGLLERALRPDGNLAVRNALARAYARDVSMDAIKTSKPGTSMAPVGDGERFITFHEDGSALLWKAGAGMTGQALSLPYPTQAGFALGDGDTLLLQPKYNVPEPVCAWSVRLQKVLRCYDGKLGNGKSSVATVALDLQRNWVVISSANRVSVWVIADGTHVDTFLAPFSAIDAMAASSQRDFVTMARGSEMLVWQPGSDKTIGPVDSALGNVRDMTVSPLFERVVFGTDTGQVGEIDPSNGRPEAAFQTFAEELTDIQGISRTRMTDGDRALMLVSSGGRLRLLDFVSAGWETPFGKRDDIVDAVFLPRAGVLATLSISGDIRLAAYESPVERRRYPEMMNVDRRRFFEGESSKYAIHALRGQIISDFGAEGTRVWDPSTRDLATYPTGTSQPDYTAAVFLSVSADAETVLRASNVGVQIWKKRGTAPVATLDMSKEDHSLEGLRLLPDGASFLYMYQKGDVYTAGVRRIDTGQDVHPPHEVFGTITIASDDGQLIADAATRSVEIYRPGSDESESIPTERDITNVAFSPDGSILAITQDDGRVVLWRVGGKRPLQSMPAHAQTASHVAFHPNGELFATAGGDSRIVLWKVGEREAVEVFTLPAGTLTALAIDRTGRFITAMLGDDVLVFAINPILLADVDTQVKLSCERLEKRGAATFTDMDYDAYSFIGKFDSPRDRNPCVKLGVAKLTPVKAEPATKKGPAEIPTGGN